MSFFKRSTGTKTSEGEGSQAAKVEPRHLTGAEFAEVISGSEIPVVVDFWAEWCGPCHAVAPAVAQLATDYAGRALVAKVDADEYPEILQNFGIMGIPDPDLFQRRPGSGPPGRYDQLQRAQEQARTAVGLN